MSAIGAWECLIVELVLEHISRDIGVVLEHEFFQESGTVGADGLGAQLEPFGYFRQGAGLADPQPHVELPRRQALVGQLSRDGTGAVHPLLGELRAHVGGVGSGAANRRENFPGKTVRGQLACCAGFLRGHRTVIFGVHAENQNGQVRTCLFDAFENFDTVQVGQADIEHQ